VLVGSPVVVVGASVLPVVLEVGVTPVLVPVVGSLVLGGSAVELAEETVVASSPGQAASKIKHEAIKLRMAAPSITPRASPNIAESLAIDVPSNMSPGTYVAKRRERAVAERRERAGAQVGAGGPAAPPRAKSAAAYIASAVSSGGRPERSGRSCASAIRLGA
jgi:hypothetical protein